MSLQEILLYGHEYVVGGYYTDDVLEIAKDMLARYLPNNFRHVLWLGNRTKHKFKDTVFWAQTAAVLYPSEHISLRTIRLVDTLRTYGCTVIVLASEKVPIRLQAKLAAYWARFGQLPASAWTYDVPACFRSKDCPVYPNLAWNDLARRVPKVVTRINAPALSELLDLLMHEYQCLGRGFYTNRATLFAGFRDHQLLGLRVCVLDDTLRTHCMSGDLLPCFCQVDNDGRIAYLWTHRCFRGLGFAETFIDLIYRGQGATDEERYRTTQPLIVPTWIDTSRAFWQRRGFVTKTP